MKHARLFLLLWLPMLPVTAGEPAVQRFAADYHLLYGHFQQTRSPAAAARLERFHQRKLAELERVDFDALNRPGQVDHLLMRAGIEQEQRDLKRLLERRAAREAYLPFRDAVRELEERRRRVDPLADEASARKLAGIAEAVKQGRKRLDEAVKRTQGKEGKEDQGGKEAVDEGADPEAGKGVSRAEAVALAGSVKWHRERLEGWYKHYAAYRPGFEWWNKQPFEAAKKALAEYEKHLREKVAGAKPGGPLIGEPVGRERLLDLLRGEFIAYTPEELVRIGEREFAWCKARGEEAAAEIGAKNWLEGLDRIKAEHAPPGEQDQLVAGYAREAMAFLDERKLVTVPRLCRDLWDVNMIEAKVQKKIPYAMYGGNRIMVAYAASGMNHEEKEMSMRGNNRHATRIVVAHEAVPGHHLQRFMAQRHRPYRGIFSTPFYVEGWALYWEIRLWELDFARGPEDRIGMLFWRMHRCARIIVSLKYHLGEMSPEEMVDFLVEEVGHEKEQATAEVRRYIDERTGPLYQAGYMLGGLQLRALHRDLVPDRMSERQFHDRVLRLGPIPVELVRASLDESIKLDPAYRASWRFYGELD